MNMHGISEVYPFGDILKLFLTLWMISSHVGWKKAGQSIPSPSADLFNFVIDKCSTMLD